MNATIFDVKEMAIHDGPGIRTTVFFKGCPLRCKWCHNPEGFISAPQLSYNKDLCLGCMSCKKTCSHPECVGLGRCIYACPRGLLRIIGEQTTAKDLAQRLLSGSKTLGDAFGGFTFSGGEPLLYSSFIIELAGLLEGHHLAIETSGYTDSDIFKRVISVIDLVIMDIKLFDTTLHKRYTGVDNSIILENFKLLKSSGKPYLIRTPLIPGITDTEENLKSIKNYIGDSEWSTLPYNPLAGAKYESLNLQYELKGLI